MDFNLPYDRNSYVRFFRSQFLPEDFDASCESISLSFSPQYTQQVTKIGQSRSLDLNVYEVKHTSERDPRVSLSKESFRLLAEYGQKRALVLFISKTSKNYRLSLVTIDLKWEEGKRPTTEYSNPKRFSFFLGPDAKVHTPQEYLIRQGRVKDFDDIKNRFSIEVVNKDFYTQIAILFTRLTGGTRQIGTETRDFKTGELAFPSPDDITRKEFAVRLIGRLVFCWFLKKKHSIQGIPLLPEELLSTDAVGKNSGYYHNVLEPLSFEVLNTPMGERAESFASKPWAIIPFLNGGLFTPHEDDYYELDDLGISKHINTFKVPDDWLHDLLEIFETYNFTIDENTPVDVELSIEPEMLGRIFENLLAEINPETGDTARKATGSYYTPRSIVEYMVDQSLKQYLLTRTSLAEDKIRSLLDYAEDEPGLTDFQKDAVLDALDAIKVIDPACGSGAFPMGALQKILLILQKIDPDSNKWLERILASVKDQLVAKELKRSVGQPNYLHKLGIIRDCIYGVDIQPVAVEISKLRCFLSLIVDQAVDDLEDNRGIKHLPNLDFKFLCANSLIGLPQRASQETMFEAKEAIKELENLRDECFQAETAKGELEKRYCQIRKKMFAHIESWGGRDLLTLKLMEWNPFSDEPATWFDPEWMFGVRNSFDLVIANPPYIDSEAMTKSMPDLRKTIAASYKAAKGNWDIYIVFFEFGLRILKRPGSLAFISPDKWISKPFGTELRKNTIGNISAIVKAGRTVFESSKVDAIVSLFQKPSCENIQTLIVEGDRIVLKNAVNKKKLRPPFALDFLFSDYLKLLLKIESTPNRLSDWFDCENACATSDAYKLKPLISDLSLRDDFDQHSQLKIINTGTIGKYTSKWGKKEMTYLKDKYLCPVVNKEEFLNTFRNTYAEKSTRPKIIIKGLTLLDACLDAAGQIIPGKSTLLISTNNMSDLKYLLALINSKLAFFYIREKYPASSYNQGINFTKHMINALPAPPVSQSQKRPFVDLINKILKLSESYDCFENSSKQNKREEYERQIDQMVYKLYGLTPEEIAIVEGHGKPD